MKRYTEDSPYGYWISKDDIIPVVDEECHVEVAILQILKKDTRRFSVYAVMFWLGYVRIVNYRDGGYGAEHGKKAKLSRLQKQFIECAEQVDIYKL